VFGYPLQDILLVSAGTFHGIKSIVRRVRPVNGMEGLRARLPPSSIRMSIAGVPACIC